jgi:hypothetical protein
MRRREDDEGMFTGFTGLDEWRREHGHEYDWWDGPQLQDDDEREDEDDGLEVHHKQRYSGGGADDG